MANFELLVGVSDVAVTDAKSIFDTSWHDSRHQYVILESELLSAGIEIGTVLDGLHIKIANEVMGRDISNFTIRLKHTTLNYVDKINGGAEIDHVGFTTVLSGYTLLRSTITANSWSPRIPFSSSFTYNGGNLAVDISRDNAGWTSGGSHFKREVTSSTARTVGGYLDSTTTYPHNNMTIKYTETNYIPATMFTGETSVPEPTLDTNWNIPTDIFPFDTSAWKRAEVKAKVSSIDGSSCKLVIEHSKTSATLESGVTLTTSTALSSGNTWTQTLSGTFTDGDWIYYRAYATNTTGALRSEKTPIRSFQYRTTGGSYAPEGTAFMQQGSASTHYRMIDVSQWQEDDATSRFIDWQAVKDDGVHHAYLRVYGSQSSADTKFTKFITEATAVGIKTGGYYYAMPTVPMSLQDARDSADEFITKLEEGYGVGKHGDLIPILDLEDNSGVAVAGQRIVDMTVEDMLQWANEFRNHFELQTGRILGLYTGDYFVRDLRNNFNHDDATGQAVVGTSGNILKDMPLWIQGYINFPRYQGHVMPSCGGWTKWHMFQWSDTTMQTGITANYTDQNWAEPMEWMMPPSDVTGVSVSDDGTNVTLTWNENPEEDIDGYYIFLDDGMSAGSYDYVPYGTTSYTFPIDAISLGAPYEYGVIANDTFGDDSLNVVTVNYTFGSTEPLTTPKVTIVSVSRTKISDEEGVDRVNITFNFDVNTLQYRVNVNGVDHTTGTIAHSGGGKKVSEMSSMTVGNLSTQTIQQISIIVAGYNIVAEVDWTELYQQGENRVNIYGRGTNGAWTEYNQEDTEFSNELGTSSYGTDTYGD